MRRALLLLTLLGACSEDLGPLDRNTETGVVSGTDDGNGVLSWLGIPYAAAPVGPLRWKPPQRPEAWDGVRDATTPGAKCPQNTVITTGGGDEDCLFLNVWTPSPRPAQPLPVMVWIHGGAFLFGAGSDPFYSGAELARRYGVVVVTINYRLGGLGFLVHPALDAEEGTSGNYGLRDQIAALEWVQRNIASFSGDPDKVTLFGESAGGYSTCVHYANPATEGLFHRAIVESGACTAGGLEQPRAQAEQDGLALGAKLGCPGSDASALACMRDAIDFAVLDATALPAINTQPPGGFFYANVPPSTLPVIDGEFLSAPIEERFAAGGFPARPLIIGTNGDEGQLFHSSILSRAVTTETQYTEALTRRFGQANAQAIAARYPIASFPTPNDALSAVSTDAFFICPARRNAKAIAAVGAEVYRYTFERALEQPLIANLGAFHSAEIPFVFGGDNYPLGKVGSATALAEQIQLYWTSFAKDGRPGTDWPLFDATETVRVLDEPLSNLAAYKTADCDFWNTL